MVDVQKPSGHQTYGDLVIIELNEYDDYDVQTYGEAFGAFTQYIDDN